MPGVGRGADVRNYRPWDVSCTKLQPLKEEYIPFISSAPNRKLLALVFGSGCSTIEVLVGLFNSRGYLGNPGAKVKIQLLKGGEVKQVITPSTPIGSGGSGSYTWKIPFNQALGKDYKVRISSTTNDAYRDVSNAAFTISAGAPFTVIAPNGGENWKRGTEKTITWKYTGNPGANVKILLLKGGEVNKVIKASTSTGSGGTGSFAWKIPANQALGNDYKIRIVSTTQPTKKDVSNTAFAITA